MQTIWDYPVLCRLTRRFGFIPKLALVGRHDAGRGDMMSPIIASSPLARMDK